MGLLDNAGKAVDDIKDNEDEKAEQEKQDSQQTDADNKHVEAHEETVYD